MKKCTIAILRGWKTLWRQTKFTKRLINELFAETNEILNYLPGVKNCTPGNLIQIDQIHQKALTNLLKNFLENASGRILPDQNYMYSRARYNWFLKRDQIYQKAYIYIELAENKFVVISSWLDSLKNEVLQTLVCYNWFVKEQLRQFVNSLLKLGLLIACWK